MTEKPLSEYDIGDTVYIGVEKPIAYTVIDIIGDHMVVSKFYGKKILYMGLHMPTQRSVTTWTEDADKITDYLMKVNDKKK